MNPNDVVLYATHRRVANLTLNRPQARNAFNAALRQGLMAAIERALADNEVRVLVLSGVGPLFSAGGDLGELAQPRFLPQEQLEQEYKPLLLQISHARKPIISAIHGTAAGIGASIALACDLSLMAEDACIYLPFSRLGLIPDGGASWQLLQAAGRKRSYEYIVGGASLSASQCQALGLCNRVVPAAMLQAETQAWAEQLAEQAPLTLAYAKQVLNRVGQMDLGDAIPLEASLQNFCMHRQDAQEGLRAFFDKRQPVFQGD